MSDQDLLTSGQAAERIGIPQQQFNRLALRGEITPEYIVPGARGARLYKPADVDALKAKIRGELEAKLRAVSA